MLIRVFQILFVLLAAGILAAYPRYHRPILLLGAATYSAGAAVSFVLNSWWPLPIAFGIALLLHRKAGRFDKLAVSSYRDLPTFLKALESDHRHIEAADARALALAELDPQIAATLATFGEPEGGLHNIQNELSRHGLGDHALRVVRDPTLLAEYLRLKREPSPDGWTDADKMLRIATLLRRHLGV